MSRIVAEALVLRHLAHIQLVCRSDGAGLQILEDGLPLYDAEDDLVQVRQPIACSVVAGVAHQRVVIAGLVLSHQEGATRDLGVNVLRRL